jgi:hypothetical protein
MKTIELVGLPEDCFVYWSELYENTEDHICDEDITYIKLSNGIIIDAGQYGDLSFFKVEVVSDVEGWDVFESVVCRTTQEVAIEIVRLANKYMDEWYSNVFISNNYSSGD